MPSSTPVLSIVYFAVAAFIGALGQYLYKVGSDKASGSLMSYVWNWQMMAGVVCYTSVMLLFIAAFRRGGAMSVLYPVYASTFIWGAIIALIAFGESIRLINIVGMLVLVLGMYLMGVGK